MIRLHTAGRCYNVQGRDGETGRCYSEQGLIGGSGPCTVYGVEMAIYVQGHHPIVRPCTPAEKCPPYPKYDGMQDTGSRTGNAATEAPPRDMGRPYA